MVALDRLSTGTDGFFLFVDTPTPVFASGPGSDQLTGDWPNTHMHDVLTGTLLRS